MERGVHVLVTLCGLEMSLSFYFLRVESVEHILKKILGNIATPAQISSVRKTGDSHPIRLESGAQVRSVKGGIRIYL